MTNIDPERAEELRRKYGMDNPPMDPRANTQVQACLRTEQITRRTWTNQALADRLLTGVPAMQTRAVDSARDFATRRAKNTLRYDTHDGDADYDPDVPWEQGATRLWRVGSDDVFVVRGRWRDSPNRRVAPAQYAAGMFANELDLAVYCDEPCNVNIAESCGGDTRLLPVERGTLLLLFRCCWFCEAALTAAIPPPPATPPGA